MNESTFGTPAYLREFGDLYQENPRQAALEWFRGARFGLFLHYGLYSIGGRHEWMQLRDCVPVREYAKLVKRFDAVRFDAGEITDMALQAKMKYVNMTTRHHDGFCLFDTRFSDFNSVNSPAKRDLVGELARECERKGLGLFLYYSHGRDWWHPHAPNNGDWGADARPDYDPPESSYMYGADHNLDIYLEFVTNQVTELLSNYGPVAGIWLDGIAVPLSRPEKMHLFRTDRLYERIHELQEQTLVSYKQQLLGTEDFCTPERKWDRPMSIPLEINTTLQPTVWGYCRADDGKHKGRDEVLECLRNASKLDANLLLNTGPLGDGSIHVEDVTTLREVGLWLQENGFPTE
jgi:alpha-L-fucosidase|tara:strand:+ start:2030 stop:3073 length:1044 start_codon:yes stop_codon:yes gene_type:complete